MSSLQGFEVVSPNTASGRSVLTVTKNYARLNKNAVLELGRPEFIEFFINPTTKQFAFKACEESNPNAIPFFIPGKTTASVTLNQQFVLDAMGPYFEFPEVNGAVFRVPRSRGRSGGLRTDQGHAAELRGYAGVQCGEGRAGCDEEAWS